MSEKGSGSHECTRSECGGAKLKSPKMQESHSEASDNVSRTGCSTVSRSNVQKICQCGRGYCNILTSTRDRSKGRRFYCCPHSSGADNHGCGMFEWVVEEGGASTATVLRPDSEAHTFSPAGDMTYSSTVYARGYLDGIIRASEQQIHALKDVVAALKKLDVDKK